MRAQLEWAVDTALAEAEAQNVEIPRPDTADLEEWVSDTALATALILAKGLSEAAGREALRRNAEIVDGFDVATEVLDHLDSLSDAHLRKVLGGALNSAQNRGRLAVFRSAESEVGAVQAGRRGVAVRAALSAPGAMRIYSSELLDQNTCPACYGVDGNDYESADDAEADYPGGGYKDCDGGDWCRGTLVAVYAEGDDVLPEPEPPVVGPSPPETAFLPDTEERVGMITSDPDISDIVEDPDGDWVEALTPEQQAALKSYTGSGYADANEALWDLADETDISLLPDVPPQSANIAAEFNRIGAPTPTVKEYAQSLQDTVLAHPLADEYRTLFRGVYDEGLPFKPSDLEPGSILQLNGFQSTTTNPTVGMSKGDYVFEISTRRGAPIGTDDLSYFGASEAEVVLAHGQQYRVHAILEEVDYKVSFGAQPRKKTVIQLIDLTS